MGGSNESMTIREAAEMLGYPVRMVTRCADIGTFRWVGRGHSMVGRREVEAFLRHERESLARLEAGR